MPVNTRYINSTRGTSPKRMQFSWKEAVTLLVRRQNHTLSLSEEDLTENKATLSIRRRPVREPSNPFYQKTTCQRTKPPSLPEDDLSENKATFSIRRRPVRDSLSENKATLSEDDLSENKATLSTRRQPVREQSHPLYQKTTCQRTKPPSLPHSLSENNLSKDKATLPTRRQPVRGQIRWPVLSEDNLSQDSFLLEDNAMLHIGRQSDARCQKAKWRYLSEDEQKAKRPFLSGDNLSEDKVMLLVRKQYVRGQTGIFLLRGKVALSVGRQSVRRQNDSSC